MLDGTRSLEKVPFSGYHHSKTKSANVSHERTINASSFCFQMLLKETMCTHTCRPSLNLSLHIRLSPLQSPLLQRPPNSKFRLVRCKLKVSYRFPLHQTSLLPMQPLLTLVIVLELCYGVLRGAGFAVCLAVIKLVVVRGIMESKITVIGVRIIVFFIIIFIVINVAVAALVFIETSVFWISNNAASVSFIFLVENGSLTEWGLAQQRHSNQFRLWPAIFSSRSHQLDLKHIVLV